MKTDNEDVLVVEDLGVSFDGFKAVDGFNFYLAKNHVHVIIGPNGAGKTTVLDLICGKTKATSGSVKFKGKELRKQQEFKIVRAGIGRKFQTPSTYENLTVFENLELSHPAGRGVFGCLTFRRTPEILERCHSVARQIGLSDKMNTEAGILSHGQKQWLEIGMLLMQDPEIIMLDEPVAGMSVRERAQTAELIRSISDHRSVIVIEHDMEFVREIADRVTVMHMGKILAEGSMDTVSKDPKVIEVYIGH
ncbi:urea ABC transporter ATP-binding protein UrtD [Luteolibacter algae]|uniref:Urea ABC transporter ATP-binding protein UrtD n=1 Tax=Luteolibacter algae TaxID=454151 RepID=A0ABW5D3B2_9BACT